MVFRIVGRKQNLEASHNSLNFSFISKHEKTGKVAGSNYVPHQTNNLPVSVFRRLAPPEAQTQNQHGPPKMKGPPTAASDVAQGTYHRTSTPGVDGDSRDRRRPRGGCPNEEVDGIAVGGCADNLELVCQHRDGVSRGIVDPVENQYRTARQDRLCAVPGVSYYMERKVFPVIE